MFKMDKEGRGRWPLFLRAGHSKHLLVAEIFVEDD